MYAKAIGLNDRMELSEDCHFKYVLYYQDGKPQFSDKIDVSSMVIFEKATSSHFDNAYICIKNGNEMRDDIKKLIDKESGKN